MFREIKKKQLILDSRKPYTNEIQGHINELDALDWIYCSMKLAGSAFTRSQVEYVLKGGFIHDISLNDHALIERHRHLYNSAANMLEMSFSLNKKMLFTFAKKLMDTEDISYRKSNLVIDAFNYNPPHPQEIDEQMEFLMNWFYSDDMDTNPILKAACLHHKIIEVYPFDSCSEAVARAAMCYYLMENGYHAFELNISQREYNMSITEYLKNEDIMPFYKVVEANLMNKTEILMEITKGVN